MKFRIRILSRSKNEGRVDILVFFFFKNKLLKDTNYIITYASVGKAFPPVGNEGGREKVARRITRNEIK